MPSIQRSPAIANQLLCALPPQVREEFISECTSVNLVLGKVLYDEGDPIRHVYFPIDGFISMLIVVDGTATLEVGMIGNEGMCGYPLFFADNVARLRALVQGEGMALRMEANVFHRVLGTTPALRIVMQRYVNVLMRQLAQTAACTRFHIVEKRLARWLLMTQDRAHADSFDVTQEFLAFMLGVRRVGVTAAARALQSGDLISYKRGKMIILNRKNLQRAACVCYKSDLDIYAQILSSRSKAKSMFSSG